VPHSIEFHHSSLKLIALGPSPLQSYLPEPIYQSSVLSFYQTQGLMGVRRGEGLIHSKTPAPVPNSGRLIITGSVADELPEGPPVLCPLLKAPDHD